MSQFGVKLYNVFVVAGLNPSCQGAANYQADAKTSSRKVNTMAARWKQAAINDRIILIKNYIDEMCLPLSNLAHHPSLLVIMKRILLLKAPNFFHVGSACALP